MPQKTYFEYVVRIYANTEGENLIKQINENEAVKDFHLVGASKLSLSQIKYAKEQQIITDMKQSFSRIEDRF